MQAFQVGATGTPIIRGTFPTTPTLDVPTLPTQTFQPDPVLTPVHRICETMAGVEATAPDSSVPGFLGIFVLLEDGGRTRPPNPGWRGLRPRL